MRKTISMSQLAKRAEQIAEDIEQSGAIYRIKRPGRTGMLLMDAAYYDGWRAAVDLMERSDSQADWEQARRAQARGAGRRLEVIAAELGLDRALEPRRRKPAARAARAGRTKGVRGSSRSGGRTE